MESSQVPSDEFHVTRYPCGTTTVLALAGELDLATVPLLGEALDGLDGDGTIVLDLDELTFVDSCGLHAIFGSAEAHDLALARPRANVRRLLALTKAENVLPVHETLEAALANVAAAG
jgi:anti-anti-sigma factor